LPARRQPSIGRILPAMRLSPAALDADAHAAFTASGVAERTA
jgi:hypothetical protein